MKYSQGIFLQTKKFWLSLVIAGCIIFVVINSFFVRDYSMDFIKLGASLPLSGINKELGTEVIEGANAYFSHINARGGVQGKHINFIFYDDKYEPQNTLVNTQKLIEKDKVFAFFGFVGTPTTQKIMPILFETQIPFIAPYTGASFLRKESSDNIVNFRSSYKEEIEALVAYLYEFKKVTKFSIFYQNDDYGEEGYNATVEALQKRGLKLVSEGTYKRNTLSIRHALSEIKGRSPEAVIIVGAYKASAHFITSAKECCLDDTFFAPISFVNSNALADELQGDTRNIIFSQTVPSYDDNSLEVGSQYRALLHFYYPSKKPSYASFESFLAAKVVVAALESIKGEITRAKFLKALKNLKANILGDIPLKFSNAQLLNRVYLSTYEDGSFLPIKSEQ